MLFASTRNPLHRLGFGAAITQGLAGDGGLYVPTEWPQSKPGSDPEDLAMLAFELLRPFVAGDALEGELAGITREAFNFPAPLIALGDSGVWTCSSCFTAPPPRSRISVRAFWRRRWRGRGAAATRPLKILVATSGDTGGAVAAAFHRQQRHRSRGAVSQGPGVADPGTAADLLGRERAQSCGARTLR